MVGRRASRPRPGREPRPVDLVQLRGGTGGVLDEDDCQGGSRRAARGREHAVPSLERTSVERFAGEWQERRRAEIGRQAAARTSGPPNDGDVWLDAATAAIVLEVSASRARQLARSERLLDVATPEPPPPIALGTQQVAAARALEQRLGLSRHLRRAYFQGSRGRAARRVLRRIRHSDPGGNGRRFRDVDCGAAKHGRDGCRTRRAPW